MTKNTKIILGVVVLVIVILIIVFYEPTEKGAIKIGFIGPLTGDVASYGQSEKNAVKLAISEINLKGGINGKKVEVIYEDGKCNGKEAATAAQKLINIDKVKIILGGACSGETLGAAPITQAEKVILFSSFASSPDITEIGDYVFRNMVSDLDGGRDVAKMIREKTVASLVENTEYSQTLENVFEQEFQKLGGNVLVKETYNPNEKDYRTQILKIKAKNPEAIFINCQSGISGGLAAKQIREMGVEIPLYSVIVFSGDDALNAAGVAANGIIFSDAPGLSKNNLQAVEFLNNYKQKYGEPANEYIIGARYDSVYILKNAIKRCSEDTDCIKDFLYNMPEYKGIIGNYRFDKNGDVIGIHYIVKKVVDGKPIELSQ
ncbi:ABC transporter substrate-binding protein [Patescibacteria group bacterium]|nr:ABC transporter substrate-binding protein [Patescibacteria group bacterium]MBU4458604.1 ABC transporter substrate-binding protein [Patescibacteria group bacterium]MCG2696259.1 ABC transporter substrate-binding protein [Candidatus Portnoybacteria bacterium]